MIRIVQVQILMSIEVGEMLEEVSVGWANRSVCGIRWPVTTATLVVAREVSEAAAACLECGARDHCDSRSRM